MASVCTYSTLTFSLLSSMFSKSLSLSLSSLLLWFSCILTHTHTHIFRDRFPYTWRISSCVPIFLPIHYSLSHSSLLPPIPSPYPSTHASSFLLSYYSHKSFIRFSHSLLTFFAYTYCFPFSLLLLKKEKPIKFFRTYTVISSVRFFFDHSLLLLPHSLYLFSGESPYFPFFRSSFDVILSHLQKFL